MNVVPSNMSSVQNNDVISTRIKLINIKNDMRHKTGMAYFVTSQDWPVS